MTGTDDDVPGKHACGKRTCAGCATCAHHRNGECMKCQVIAVGATTKPVAISPTVAAARERDAEAIRAMRAATTPSRLVCGLCLSNMVRLADDRFHCARCKLMWTVESTAAHPRECPNGLDCPCYDQPWTAPRNLAEEVAAGLHDTPHP